MSQYCYCAQPVQNSPLWQKERGTAFLLCWPPFVCSFIKVWMRWHIITTSSVTVPPTGHWTSDLGHLAVAAPRLQNNIHHSHFTCLKCYLHTVHNLCHLHRGLVRHSIETSILSNELHIGWTFSTCLIGQMYHSLGCYWSYLLWKYYQSPPIKNILFKKPCSRVLFNFVCVTRSFISCSRGSAVLAGNKFHHCHRRHIDLSSSCLPQSILSWCFPG